MKRIAFSIVALVACSTYDVPDSPSFQVDVMPILAANCVRCHGYPVLGGAPEHARYDTFANLRVGDGVVRRDVCAADDNIVCGASTMAGTIAMRVQPGSQGPEDRGPMPPRFALEDFQVDTLVKWAEQGGVRGAPRPNNRPPTVVIETIDQSARVVVVSVRVADADGDLVAGELITDNDDVVGSLRSGHSTVTWTAPDAGSYELRARVDDGAGFVELALGTVDVP